MKQYLNMMDVIRRERDIFAIFDKHKIVDAVLCAIAVEASIIPKKLPLQ